MLHAQAFEKVDPARTSTTARASELECYTTHSITSEVEVTVMHSAVSTEEADVVPATESFFPSSCDSSLGAASNHSRVIGVRPTPRYWRLASYQMVHAGLHHIGFNMFAQVEHSSCSPAALPVHTLGLPSGGWFCFVPGGCSVSSDQFYCLGTS